MYRAAYERAESRAMHRRDDATQTEAAHQRRLRVGGLDTVWVEPETPVRQELAS